MRVGLVEQRAAALDERARGFGKRLAAAGLDLDLRRDQLARGVLAERRRVGPRLQLREAVDEAVRLGIDDLELLLDREGEILRTVEDPRASSSAANGSGMLRPIAASLPAVSGRRLAPTAAARICRYRSRGAVAPGRTSCCWACPPWSAGRSGLWAAPIVALRRARGRLDGGRVDARARGQRTRRASAPARPGLREVEVERVQELDRRARAVHDHVRRRLQERLGVVEDDVHAGLHELVGDALRGAVPARR